MDLNKIVLFQKVVDCDSFSGAAKALKLPTSSVSRGISALEHELGCRLIHRTTHSLRLTDAGKEFYRKTRQPLNDLATAALAVTGTSEELKGSIKISVPEDIGIELMAGVCIEFMQNHPDISIDLSSTNERVDLNNTQFDFTIRIGDPGDQSLVQQRIGDAPLIVVGSPALVRRVNDLSDPECLAYLPYLDFSGINHSSGFTLYKGRHKRVVRLTPHFSSSSFFVLRSMAELDAGFSLMPTFLARDMVQSGRLSVLCEGWRSKTFPVHILHSSLRPPSLRVRKFMEFVKRSIASKLRI